MCHQPYVGHTGLTSTIAIEDMQWSAPVERERSGLIRLGHAREGNSIDGDDVVFSLHAGAARLGQWLHQKMGVVGVLKRRPSAMRVEEAVEDCSRASYIKQGRTNNQYGQQQIRKFGEVGFHGPNKAFLLLL